MQEVINSQEEARQDPLVKERIKAAMNHPKKTNN